MSAVHPNDLRCRGSDGLKPRPTLCPQRGHCRRYLAALADPHRLLNQAARTMDLPRVAGQACHYFKEVGIDEAE